jgi:hypothetical protein
MKKESKSCLQWLVGKVLEFPIYQKSFKKSTCKLESQYFAGLRTLNSTYGTPSLLGVKLVLDEEDNKIVAFNFY